MSAQIIDHELLPVASSTVAVSLTDSKLTRTSGSQVDYAKIVAKGFVINYYLYADSNQAPIPNQSFQMAVEGIIEIKGYENLKNAKFFQVADSAGKIYVEYGIGA